jgi:TolB-like protein
MKMSINFILVLVLLVTPCFSQSELDKKMNELTSKITQNMIEKKKTKLAVIEFSDLDKNITELGKFLAEELITKLFLTGKFEVVERQLLNKIISQHKLSFTGIVDPKSAKKLGKILGVDAIASGTITDLSSSIKVNARLIRVDTGSIIGVAAIEIKKDESIKNLMQKSSVSMKSNDKSTLDISRKNSGSIKIYKLLGKVYRISLTLDKIQIVNLKEIKIDLILENHDSLGYTNFIRFVNPEEDIYIIDNENKEYKLIKAPKELYEEKGMLIAAKSRKKIQLLFSVVVSKVKSFKFVSVWHSGWGYTHHQSRLEKMLSPNIKIRDFK